MTSDNPAYFGGYPHDNVAAATRALRPTPEHRRWLARSSFHAGFLPQAEKDRHFAAVAAAAG